MTDTVSTADKKKDDKAIIIDLFAPNVPGSTKEGDLIQKSLRDQLVDDIKNSVSSSSNDSPSQVVRFIDESGRNVFFVDGTRGAGKTTFINSVVERLNKDKEDSGIKIKCLPTIDPTKLPRHEPILVTVTARLNVLVSKKLNENWASDNHKKKKEQWQNQLEKLKRGLHLLTAKEYKPEYFSDALKLDAQLDYSIGGQDLPEIFDTLVNYACDILNCNAILISFDDIDTQFDAGWDVLESIRKFFNSSKLVVVATGDLRLYSQLIRGKQYENYSKTLLDQEKESARLAERGYMVEHLEQQYLLKLFPVQKRIQLKTMLQLVGEKGEAGKERVIVKTEKGETKSGDLSVRDAIENAVKEGLYLRGGSDADMYADELLKQPVRLLMQVLQDYYTKKYPIIDSLDLSSDADSENGLKEKQSVARKYSPGLMRNALYGAMLSSIYRAGLNYEQHRFGMDSLCKDIFLYTSQDGDYNTGFYLRPQSEAEALRNCSVYLSSQVSETCKNSLSKSLRLLLVGCGSVSIYNQFVLRASEDHERRERLMYEYISYMSVGRNESATHWANRCCAVVSKPGVQGVFLGTVQLNRGGGTKEGIYSPFNLNREKGLAKASMAVSLSAAASSNMMSFTSVFNLIGAISDLADHATDSDERAISIAFNKALAQPTCIVPPWSAESERGEMKGGDDEYEHESESDDQFNKVLELLIGWLGEVAKANIKITPSSLLIGKVWTRLYFNLNDVADKHGGRLYKDASGGEYAIHSNAAKVMRFNVLAFLHAVLVEEDLYHSVSDIEYVGSDLRTNPVTSVVEFRKKLTTINKALKEKGHNWEDTHPLFFCLIKCPLIHPFLFPVGGVNTSSKSIKEERLFDDCLFEITGKRFMRSDDNVPEDTGENNGSEDVDGSGSDEKFEFFGVSTLNIASISSAEYQRLSHKSSEAAEGQ